MSAEHQAVGVVGLGAMGKPLALHLLDAGWDVSTFARRAGVVEELVAAGARRVERLEELAERAPLVLTSLPDAAAVREVGLALAAAGAELTLVDTSTISPAAARELAAELGPRGIAYLDAPVSGGPSAAADGSLAVMVGGEPAAFERATRLLEAIGSEVEYLGPSGSGQVCKAVNQLIVLGTIELVAEALATAKASGLDPAAVRRLLLGGYARSRILDLHGQKMIDGDFTPGGRARFHDKDVANLAELSRVTGIGLPAFEAAAAQLQLLLDAGGGDLDHSALIQVVENARKEAR
jgi:2-hydroxy-3-oxopropionate reductase